MDLDQVASLWGNKPVQYWMQRRTQGVVQDASYCSASEAEKLRNAYMGSGMGSQLSAARYMRLVGEPKVRNKTPYWQWVLFKIDTLRSKSWKTDPSFCKNVDNAVWPKSDPFSTILLTRMRSSIIFEWPPGDCAHRQWVKSWYRLWSAIKGILSLTNHAHGWLTYRFIRCRCAQSLLTSSVETYFCDLDQISTKNKQTKSDI